MTTVTSSILGALKVQRWFLSIDGMWEQISHTHRILKTNAVNILHMKTSYFLFIFLFPLQYDFVLFCFEIVAVDSL